MPWALLDTSVYIGHWERGLYRETLAAVQQAFVVRHSAVVLSELRRGARTPTARRLVDALFRVAVVQWEPTAGDWWNAGKLIQAIGDAQGWDGAKRRDFQNDALIALTARRHGATVVTANRRDFALLEGMLRVTVLPVWTSTRARSWIATSRAGNSSPEARQPPAVPLADQLAANRPGPPAQCRRTAPP